MATRMIGLVCLFCALAGGARAMAPAPGRAARHPPLVRVQLEESPNGLTGADRSPACAAAGGIGSDTDCRRNNVQIDPNSGRALNQDDQCRLAGGTLDGMACLQGDHQIDPYSGQALQPGDPDYVPRNGQN